MKLYGRWPSKFKWVFEITANLAYKDRWKLPCNLEKVNNRIVDATGADSLKLAFPEESNMDIDLTLEFDHLKNDEKIFKLFPILQEFGMFSFDAALMASSRNEIWDAYVAYYEYDPSRWTGIKRTYISCSECDSLCHRLQPDDIYTFCDVLLWLRYDRKVREDGGTIYLDMNDRIIPNKQPVHGGLREKEEEEEEEDDGSL